MTASIKKIMGIPNIGSIRFNSLFNDAALQACYLYKTGALTTDSTANARTLTNNNSIGESIGTYGDAADFGASNTTKYFNITNTFGISSNIFSIATLVKIDTYPASNTASDLMVLHTGGGNYYLRYYNSGGIPTAAFLRNDGVTQETAGYYGFDPKAEWHLIVATANGAAIKLYIDGALVASATASTTNRGGTDGLSIGNNNAGASYTKGQMEESYIFSKTLSDAEVLSLSQPTKIKKINSLFNTQTEIYNTHFLNDPSLITYLRMEGNANDTKGVNNGTASNVSFNSSYGKYGQGARFVAASSPYISLANSVSLAALGDVASSYAIGLWFRSSTKADQSLTEKWTATYPWAFRGPFATNGGIMFAVYDNGANNAVAQDLTRDYADGLWHFAVGVRDKSISKVKLYLDGNLRAEQTDNSGDVRNTGPTIIGARSTGGQFFNGDIDEFFILGRAPTIEEIGISYRTTIKKFMNISNV